MEVGRYSDCSRLADAIAALMRERKVPAIDKNPAHRVDWFGFVDTHLRLTMPAVRARIGRPVMFEIQPGYRLKVTKE